MIGAFRVSEDTPWFRAVLQVAEQYERETIRGAHKAVANTNMCISALGNAEGAAELAARFVRLREQAVRGADESEGGGRKAEG